MSETEFSRNIRLLNELSGNEDSVRRFECDPEEILNEFGIEGEEADRFKERYEDGDLRVLGWRITQDFEILSPWPLTHGDREVWRIEPNQIEVGQEVEVTIRGTNFRIGDRVGFRGQGEAADFEAHEIDRVDSGTIVAKVKATTTGLYDVAVGRLASAGFLNSSFSVR